MFRWFKQFFVEEKKPETVSKSVVLPNKPKKVPIDFTKQFDNLRCKHHPKYDGIKDPDSKINCNECWEFHYQRTKISN